MDINYSNRSSFEFYQSIYDRGNKDIEQYVKNLGAQKFSYFRIYQGGNYFLFSNDSYLIEKVLFLSHENPPYYMTAIQNFSGERSFVSTSPTKIREPGLDFLKSLGWFGHAFIYFRYENYIDGFSLTSDIKNNLYSGYWINHLSLFKKIYWLVREKINVLVPFDKPGVLSQFRNGADITYRPPKENFHLPELEEKAQALLEDMSRKKLSLTAREWEVCKGLARGETAKETARILGVKYRTVQTHLDKMYRKFSNQLGYKPTRAQVVQQLYSTMDKDLLTRTLWEPSLIK